MAKKRNDPRQDSLFAGATINLFLGDGPKQLEDGGAEQLSAFEFGLRRVLKIVLEEAGKSAEAPMDRAAVAAAMSKILNREISKAHLDEWTAMSKVGRRIHADALKALCEATGDWRAFHYFVEACGFKALEPDMAICAEFGAQTALIEHLQKGQKKLKADLDHPDVLGRITKKLTGGGA